MTLNDVVKKVIWPSVNVNACVKHPDDVMSVIVAVQKFVCQKTSIFIYIGLHTNTMIAWRIGMLTHMLAFLCELLSTGTQI